MMNAMAEIEYECQANIGECERCQDRFRCWTNKTLILSPTRLTLNRDVSGLDEVEFTAYLPKHFRCGSMCGSGVKVTTMVDNTIQVFEGVVIAQYMMAEENTPMQITIKGRRERYF